MWIEEFRGRSKGITYNKISGHLILSTTNPNMEEEIEMVRNGTH
jgi:hypothetical protein